jgi:hypothetical protein
LTLGNEAYARSAIGTIVGVSLTRKDFPFQAPASWPGRRTCRAVRDTVTSENGDYIFPYFRHLRVRFELSGFTTQTRTAIAVAPQTGLAAQVSPRLGAQADRAK